MYRQSFCVKITFSVWEIVPVSVINNYEKVKENFKKMAKGRGKKKAKNISNVYSMFEQSQIQEFKEAFGMIDANQDGFIDKDWIYLISAVIYFFFWFTIAVYCFFKSDKRMISDQLMHHWE